MNATPPPLPPPFLQGDLVKYQSDRSDQLLCGYQVYERAVVVSLMPFILISESGDMKWTATCDPTHFEKCGEADRAALIAVMNRLSQDHHCYFLPELPH